MEVRPSWASPTPTKTLLLVKTSTRGYNMGCNVVHYSPEGRQDRILTVKGGCQQISVPALTSTLNGCSSPFTAHKIHSNNCKHNVPIQQLLRHLLLRSADRAIVNPAVVAQRLSFIYSRHEQTDNGDKSYTFSSDIAGCLGVCLSSGAESRAEESRAEERRGEERGRRSGFVDRSPRRSQEGGCPRGKSRRQRLSAASRSRSPRVSPPLHRPLFQADTSDSFSAPRGIAARFQPLFPTECACARWHERAPPPPQSRAPVQILL